VNWMQSWLTTSYPDLWLLFLGALFMGVVMFFPDGLAGAVQRLGGLRPRWRPETISTAVRAAPMILPPSQSIGDDRLDAPPLERATLGPNRARGSDTTA